MSHDNAAVVRNIEDAITTDLKENAVFAYTDPGWMAHKDLADVHNTADIHSWLRIGLAPLLFKKSRVWSEVESTDTPWPEGHPISRREQSRYLHYNQIIGGLSLTQRRANRAPCRHKEVADKFGMECDDADKITSINLNEPPLAMAIMNERSQPDPELTRWFLIVESNFQIRARFKQLELSNWVDNTTVHVAAGFLLYNAHYDVLTASEFHIFVSRSGHYWKKITHDSLFLLPYNSENWALFLSDATFAALICWLLVTEVLEVLSTFRSRNRRGWTIQQTLSFYGNVWNLVDWISISGGLILIGMWVSVVIKVLQVKEDILMVADSDKAFLESGGNWVALLDFEATLKNLHETVQGANHIKNDFRFFSSLYPVALALRLFKAFHAQPRLSLVTHTLMRASTDVLHYLVVFMSIFLTYVTMATSLFGREIEAFSTLERSFTTCFVVLMGDFDVAAMWEVGRGLAVVWFITFHVIIVLIMLNMLLAIIMDTYSDVKGHIQNAQTMGFQLKTLWRRWRQLRQGQRVSLTYIENQLTLTYREIVQGYQSHLAGDNSGRKASSFFSDLCSDGEFADGEVMSVSEFKAAVKGLPESQACRLMENSVQEWRLVTEQPLGLADAVQLISTMHNEIIYMIELEKEGLKSDEETRHVLEERSGSMIGLDQTLGSTNLKPLTLPSANDVKSHEPANPTHEITPNGEVSNHRPQFVIPMQVDIPSGKDQTPAAPPKSGDMAEVIQLLRSMDMRIKAVEKQNTLLFQALQGQCITDATQRPQSGEEVSNGIVLPTSADIPKERSISVM
eukprot:gnl/MRDRNA2_/MRDRNA2_144749_c0_seq1.p1 gnl/MRDRNA2_/MRDRNA2_144749_c0~~gnl/MRDRNA2_/MRDRNA2_144749_c0_seq1.p1  ORF type:complete len:858 (-),score=133.15 gnl/MRDRNA2_/MRDRNA2_144749_c0_seq1:10-2394(-)